MTLVIICIIAGIVGITIGLYVSRELHRDAARIETRRQRNDAMRRRLFVPRPDLMELRERRVKWHNLMHWEEN
jgi:hypothetical protein